MADVSLRIKIENLVFHGSLVNNYSVCLFWLVSSARLEDVASLGRFM